AGHHVEKLAREMVAAANTVRAKTNPAGIGLGVSNELRNRLGRNRWVHHHDVVPSDHAWDRWDVGEEIEIEVFVERCVGRAGGAALEERVSVGRRTYNRFGADIAAAARTVLDDERLAEALRQPLTHQTGDDVSRS